MSGASNFHHLVGPLLLVVLGHIIWRQAAPARGRCGGGAPTTRTDLPHHLQVLRILLDGAWFQSFSSVGASSAELGVQKGGKQSCT